MLATFFASQAWPQSPSFSFCFTSLELTIRISGTVARKMADGSLSVNTTVYLSGALVLPGSMMGRNSDAAPFFIASMRSML